MAQGGVISLSVIHQTEWFYGWARRGHPSGVDKLIGGFLAGVEVLPWTDAVARGYGDLRAACEA